MSQIISWVIVGFLYNMVYCFLFSKINDDVKFKLNYKMILLCIIFALINCYIIINNMTLRPVIVNIGLFIIIYFTYKKSIIKTIMSVFLFFLLITFIETFFFVVLTFFFNINLKAFVGTLSGMIILNVLCLATSIVLYNLKFINNFMKLILKWCEYNKIFKIVFLTILTLVTISTLTRENLYVWNSLPSLILVNSFILCILTFVILYFKENMNKNKVLSNYDNLMDYVKIYENLLDEKSKNQHEYNNQLILIKGMIPKTNKKVTKYIDGLLKICNSDINYEWLNRLKNIPLGGLKGLIYYKIMIMNEKGIKVYVDINNNLEDKKVWNFFNKYLQDISKVIGVYIDNAIEAAEISEKKFIIIEAEKIDNSIVFTFSNTYKGNINMDLIDEIGWSTKGKTIGRGYGLSLVKDIINNRKLFLSQQREINGIYYVEKLIINNKKISI